MVVVVIIGVLVAIAVPFYTGVQRNAANQANAANIRTIDGAIAIFLTENHAGTPTPTNLVAGAGGSLQSWPVPPALFGTGAAYTVTAVAPFRAVGPAALVAP